MTDSLLRVGELYIPGRTAWPETAEYNYRGGAHELRLFYADPSAAEIQAITRRPAEFGAVAIGPVLFFLFRFGADGWSDCPYSWHLVKAQRPDQATLPEPLQDLERALLHVILVDATTGIVRGLRTCSLSIGLSRYLHEQIRQQAVAPFDPAAYDAELLRVYATTSTEALARQAERCTIR